MGDVTRILVDIEEGDMQATERLLPLLYDELRRLATQMMAREKLGLTLQATALVHEAYVRLVDVAQAPSWKSRGHFFAAAAEAMRRILVERARRKQSLKEGGEFERIELGDLPTPTTESTVELLDLNDALTQLEQEEPQKAELVKLRYFAGLTHEETAEVLGISPATAKRHWAYARAWLYGRLLRK